MALAGATSGFIGLVLISHFVRPMFVSRYLIGCLPLAVIAAVGGWSLIWPRWRMITAALVIGASLLILGTSIDRTRPVREDYRSAAIDVMARLAPGDAIVAYPGSSTPGLIRYLPEGTPTQRLVASVQQPGSWVIENADGSAERPRRLWVVIRGASPPPGLRDWIATNYPLVLAEGWYGDVRLQLRASTGG